MKRTKRILLALLVSVILSFAPKARVDWRLDRQVNEAAWQLLVALPRQLNAVLHRVEIQPSSFIYSRNQFPL
ncbi:MAG: hypothetical protein WC508_03575 [Patescibacteria group bacterium]